MQSHYRVCQIQLVAEFAAQERVQVKASRRRLWAGYEADALIRLMETKKK